MIPITRGNLQEEKKNPHFNFLGGLYDTLKGHVTWGNFTDNQFQAISKQKEASTFQLSHHFLEDVKTSLEKNNSCATKVFLVHAVKLVA